MASALDLTTVTPSDLGRWAELGRSAVEPNPFFEPDFVLGAHRARPAARPVLIVSRDRAGTWTGAMPMWRTGRWKGIPAPMTASWVHGYCFVGAPLLAPGVEVADTCARLLDAAHEAIGSGLFVALEHLPTDGPLGAVLDAGDLGHGWRLVSLAQRSRAVLSRPAGRRPPGPAAGDVAGTELDGFLALPGRKRRELARHARRLADELGGELVTVERSAEPSAVDAFLTLEAAGWKGAAGTAFSSTAADQAFFRQLCASMAGQGRLELLSYECDGRPVAMKCNIRTGATVHCFKIAHDPAVSRHSPGVLLELVNLERFAADPSLERMDSCADPDNAMINRLWAGRRTFAVAAAARGARTHLFPALRTAARIRTTGGHP